MKAMVRVEFPACEQSEQLKINMKRQSKYKFSSSKSCHFVAINRQQTSLCKCSMCLHCVNKVSDANS